MEAARRQADEGTHLPRSAKLAALALYGLLAVIWVSIAVSPIEVRWLAFGVGFVLGWVVHEVVFRLARRSAATSPGSAATG